MFRIDPVDFVIAVLSIDDSFNSQYDWLLQIWRSSLQILSIIIEVHIVKVKHLVE